ncbi:MAG: M4 family metallopeptidase [Deltaproteobacteria bacterium]|nr:M4 family metallopeptidase [Deltaproteobacteria bacterium]
MKSTSLLLAFAVSAVGLPRAVAAPAGSSAWARFARVERVVLDDDGVPAFVRGDLGQLDAARVQAARTADAVDAALRGALPAIAGVFGLDAGELGAIHVSHDALGMTHVRYVQRHAGLRVVGGDVAVHVAADGMVRAVNGTARPIDLGAVPTLARVRAIAIARAATAGDDLEVFAGELVYVLSSRDGTPHLAWEIGVRSRSGEPVVDLVYVEAHAGAIVDRHPQVFTARNRVVYDGQGKSPPFFGAPGPVLGNEAGAPSSDTTALAAFDNTGITYDCYQTLYGRDSYDDSGATLNSVVHVTFPTQNGGKTGNNAAWIAFPTGQMVYGDGDGTFMGPTSKGFDVTAHELTHAVTSSTAKLNYQNESGALNEAMSDIMASRCEAWRDGGANANTWLIGEEIFTPATPGDGLRYMNDPQLDKDLYPAALGGSRDFYSDRYTGSEDNGGVHLNSGIANLAFYLLVEGGMHPRGKTTFAVPGIGIDKAGAIFQRALTQGYMTANTTFAKARTATEMAAMDLYSGSEVAAVGAAWAAVGIGAPPAADTTPPTVTITAPADGATVMPGFGVEVTANDDRGVLRVELAVDGTTVGTDDAAPYSFTTDAAIAGGAHTLTATAFDASNQATATVTVTVAIPGQNPDAGAGGDGDAGVGADDGGPGGGCDCAAGGDPAGALFAVGAVALGLRRRRRR